MSSLTPVPDIAPLILILRGQRVILDADLAKLYGVQTGHLNRAVKRNQARFPGSFMFTLTREEAEEANRSRCQIGTLKRGQNIKYLPMAFTEHGALQASNVLNNPQAVSMSIFIINAFIRMREEIAANTTLEKRLAVIEKTLTNHDSVLRDLIQQIRPLLLPPPDPPRKKIGFHSK